MRISEEHKTLNKELHSLSKNFGGGGWKRAVIIYENLIKPYSPKTILDYGCGKGTLSNKLKADYAIDVDNYDPCVPKFKEHPGNKRYDAVICSDVLEHVEPDLLDAVLQDIATLGLDVFYLEVGLTASNKKLPDGRDNHLIIKPANWWVDKFKTHGLIHLKTLENFISDTDPHRGHFSGIYKKSGN